MSVVRVLQCRYLGIEILKIQERVQVLRQVRFGSLG